MSSEDSAARVSSLAKRLLPPFAAAWRHGVKPSDFRTPLSRASCSRVTGAKDPVESSQLIVIYVFDDRSIPTPQTAKISAARPVEYHPLNSRSVVGLTSSPSKRGARTAPSSRDIKIKIEKMRVKKAIKNRERKLATLLKKNMMVMVTKDVLSLGSLTIDFVIIKG